MFVASLNGYTRPDNTSLLSIHPCKENFDEGLTLQCINERIRNSLDLDEFPALINSKQIEIKSTLSDKKHDFTTDINSRISFYKKKRSKKRKKQVLTEGTEPVNSILNDDVTDDELTYPNKLLHKHDDSNMDDDNNKHDKNDGNAKLAYGRNCDCCLSKHEDEGLAGASNLCTPTQSTELLNDDNYADNLIGADGIKLTMKCLTTLNKNMDSCEYSSIPIKPQFGKSFNSSVHCFRCPDNVVRATTKTASSSSVPSTKHWEKESFTNPMIPTDQDDEMEGAYLLHMISNSLDRFNAILHSPDIKPSNMTSGLGDSMCLPTDGDDVGGLHKIDEPQDAKYEEEKTYFTKPSPDQKSMHQVQRKNKINYPQVNTIPSNRCGVFYYHHSDVSTASNLSTNTHQVTGNFPCTNPIKLSHCQPQQSSYTPHQCNCPQQAITTTSLAVPKYNCSLEDNTNGYNTAAHHNGSGQSHLDLFHDPLSNHIRTQSDQLSLLQPHRVRSSSSSSSSPPPPTSFCVSCRPASVLNEDLSHGTPVTGTTNCIPTTTGTTSIKQQSDFNSKECIDVHSNLKSIQNSIAKLSVDSNQVNFINSDSNNYHNSNSEYYCDRNPIVPTYELKHNHLPNDTILPVDSMHKLGADYRQSRQPELVLTKQHLNGQQSIGSHDFDGCISSSEQCTNYTQYNWHSNTWNSGWECVHSIPTNLSRGISYASSTGFTMHPTTLVTRTEAPPASIEEEPIQCMMPNLFTYQTDGVNGSLQLSGLNGRRCDNEVISLYTTTTANAESSDCQFGITTAATHGSSTSTTGAINLSDQTTLVATRPHSYSSPLSLPSSSLSTSSSVLTMRSLTSASISSPRYVSLSESSSSPTTVSLLSVGVDDQHRFMMGPHQLFNPINKKNVPLATGDTTPVATATSNPLFTTSIANVNHGSASSLIPNVDAINQNDFASPRPQYKLANKTANLPITGKRVHKKFTNQIKRLNDRASSTSSSSSLHRCINHSGLFDLNGHQKPATAKWRRACSFYLRGHCKKEDCEFAHDLTQVTCKFWEMGECFKGPTCPFLHGYPSDLLLDLSG